MQRVGKGYMVSASYWGFGLTSFFASSSILRRAANARRRIPLYQAALPILIDRRALGRM